MVCRMLPRAIASFGLQDLFQERLSLQPRLFRSRSVLVDPTTVKYAYTKHRKGQADPVSVSRANHNERVGDGHAIPRTESERV